MRFADITGHDSVKQLLRSLADDDRMPHALLLEGPEGIGKHMLARAITQRLHCAHPTPDGDACGECPACRQHQTWNHIDTYHVFPVLRSDAIKHPVSDDFFTAFRAFVDANPLMDSEAWAAQFGKKNACPIIYVYESDALARKLATTAHSARYKVALVWQAEKMNEQCANKLLKLIEEPHSDTLFIMTANSTAEMLPTVLSRCRRVEVAPLSEAEVAGYLLANGLVADATDADAFASLAEGSLLAARALASAATGGSEQLSLFIELMRLAYSRRVAELKIWAEKVAELGRESEVRFYTYCQRMVRENFMANFGEPRLLSLNDAEAAFSRNFARFITPNNAPGLVDAFNRAAIDIAGNANGKIVNFDTALLTTQLIRRHQ